MRIKNFNVDHSNQIEKWIPVEKDHLEFRLVRQETGENIQVRLFDEIHNTIKQSKYIDKQEFLYRLKQSDSIEKILE